MKKILFFFPLLLIISACNSSNDQLTEQQRGDITAVISKAVDSIGVAAFLLSSDSASAMYISGEDAVFAEQGKVTVSRDSILSKTRAMYRGMKRYELTISTKRIFVLSPAAAVVTFDGRAAAVNTKGKTYSDLPMAMTLVFSKIGDQWNVVHGHRSFGTKEIQKIKTKVKAPPKAPGKKKKR